MNKPNARPRPNVLLITSDQYRFPRFSYGPDAGFAQPLKEILGFQGKIGADNPYAKFFPGLMRLRKNAVLLRNHTIASSACTPSRTVIYTGQYSTRTGVTSTDGVFKNADTANFPWLAADGIPTLGSWMRGAGYSTHYFGKWHVSNPPSHSLDAYGFDDWELSYPEPHGSSKNNLGTYRDVAFTDAASSFVRRMGLGVTYDRLQAIQQEDDPDGPAPSKTPQPWFAVLSLANPHDIATYPGVIAQALPGDQPPRTITLSNGKVVTLPGVPTQSVFGPLTVPVMGDLSTLPIAGSMQVPLNPLGFPQNAAAAAPTQNEDLSTKPSCQLDSSYKVGLALSSKMGYTGAAAFAGILPQALLEELGVTITLMSGVPFNLTRDPTDACLKFIQFYAYLHSVVDPHVNRILDALEASGQMDNTIVMFLTDHGEYAAAHGMLMEKWYAAYQEAVHVPMLIQLNPRAAKQEQVEEKLADQTPPVRSGVTNIDAVTSHADILPTILGLAGVTEAERAAIRAGLIAEGRPVPPLPGVDLADLIHGRTNVVREHDGEPRKGVLFITDDEITQPLPVTNDPHEKKSLQEFGIYLEAVRAVIAGTLGKGPIPKLVPGPVRQPNHIRCVRTAQYKLARYFDPNGRVPDEWEMYDLQNDPNEALNLVQVNVNPPTILATGLPTWTDAGTLQKTTDELAALLAALEARDLSTDDGKI